MIPLMSFVRSFNNENLSLHFFIFSSMYSSFMPRSSIWLPATTVFGISMNPSMFFSPCFTSSKTPLGPTRTSQPVLHPKLTKNKMRNHLFDKGNIGTFFSLFRLINQQRACANQSRYITNYFLLSKIPTLHFSWTWEKDNLPGTSHLFDRPDMRKMGTVSVSSPKE